MRSKESFKEGPEELTIIGSFLRIRKKIAGALLFLTLFFTGPNGKSEASKVYNSLNQPPKQEIVLQTPQAVWENLLPTVISQLQEKKENITISDEALKITREINDPEMIKEFLQLDSYMGLRRGFGEPLTIDIPSRFDFGPSVRSQTEKFFKGLGITIVDPETLETLKGQKKKIYKVEGIVVKGRVREEKDFLMDLILQILRTEAERKGVRIDFFEKIIENLITRVFVTVILEITIRDVETGKYLILRGIGIPREVGLLQKDEAFISGITNAFDNLSQVIKEALERRSLSFYSVVLITKENLAI